MHLSRIETSGLTQGHPSSLSEQCPRHRERTSAPTVIASEGEAIQLETGERLRVPTPSLRGAKRRGNPASSCTTNWIASQARNDDPLPPTRHSPLPTRHSPLATFHPPSPTLDTTTAPLPPELEQVHWKYPPFFHGTGAEWRCVGEGLACGQKAAKRRWTCRERVFISPHDRTVQAPSAIARVAQLVEQATENRCVGGSIPPSGTTHFPQ